MAKEWVNKARNDAKIEVHFCLELEKALGAMKEENKDLLSKLTAEERERKSDVHEIYTIKYSHIYIFSLTFMLFCD